MDFFPFFFGFLGILGPPYCGIGATIRIGQEILCLPYAGFFILDIADTRLNRPRGKMGKFEVGLRSVPYLLHTSH